jgi:regulator of replication initiation timing
MSQVKTKSIENIERRMDGIDSKSLRYQVLQNVKDFKTSWIGLGQALYAVWKDKLYKEWGYSQFDAYTSKEIGIRKQTAMKLLKSYYFLEKEEPEHLKKNLSEDITPEKVPSHETVNALRLASKRKDIDRADYVRMKENVFTSGKDARDVRVALTQLIKERDELEPEEAHAKRRMAVIKRLVSLLKSVRQEIKITKLLPAEIIKDADRLINKLESEISS